MAKKFKINASDGSIKRYSDVVPQEKRRYWYFTTHGIGPGMLPSDVKILETKEGQNKKGTWGDFICLDSVLNTDELKAYDLIELAPDMVESACGSKKAVKSATRKPLRKQAVKANWASKGKKQKIYKSFELGNYFLFELGKDFIGVSINNSYPEGKAWLGARIIKCADAKDLFAYLQKNLTDNATWNQIERTIANSEFDAKIDTMGGFVSDKNMRKPTKSVETACNKRRAVKASDVDADRPNSAPNSWKSSQRMAYKVTEDQTKGERTFPTSIDDVYKVLGEMQGTWTNPTTGWTGDCEIYERDLDDGSYIFSLVFGGNELEPDDILYVPGGFDYYSNKPKFTIYPHSGAPTFADSLEDFKRKLKKEYSYLRKVDDVNSACGKTKTVKASAVAKYKANRAIKAGINAPSTDGPLCVCENCKAEIESREGRQTVYNVISDLDIEPDERLICDWCEDEATELYQISPDDIEGAKKAIKCASSDNYNDIDETMRFRVCSYYDTKFRNLAECKVFDDFDEAVDYAHECLGNGPTSIEDYYVGTVEIDPDEYWENFDGEFWCTPELAQFRDEVWKSMGIDASTDVNADLQLNKDSADRKKYNWGKNPITDLDGYVKDIADGVVDRFPNLTYEISDEAITFSDENNNVVYVQPIDEIVPEKEDLENDTDDLANAIQHEQEESDWYNQNTDADEVESAKEAVKCSEDYADADVQYKLYSYTADGEDVEVDYLDDYDETTVKTKVSEIFNSNPEIQTIDVEKWTYMYSDNGTYEDYEYVETFERDSVIASASDDELEPIMGDGFGEDDMGYGFDSNGDPISESMVDELERIAGEILAKSEIADINEYADLHNFNYYASIPYIQESFDISFTYSAYVDELSKLGFISDNARMLTTAAPYDIHINVRCKNGEVERVDINDITEASGYVKDADLKNFNLEAIEQYIKDIVNPVAMDIYNGTTNI